MISEIKRQFLEEQGRLQARIAKSNGTGSYFAKDDADGLYFANALERVDAYLHKPLSRFYWMEAMPILYGGGAVEYASFFRVNYLSYDANKNSASGSQNVITEVKATIEKQRTVVRAYSWKVDIGWIDQMKYDQIGWDVLSTLDEGARLYYNQKLDDIAFKGFVDEGIADAYGLINNANITATVSDKNWDEMTPVEMFDELNSLLYNIYSRTGYSRELMPNHILVPPELYSVLVQPMVIGNGSAGLATSLIKYFNENNVGREMFGDWSIMILPVPYLSTIGANGTGRIVAYPFDQRCVRLPLPMDLTRGASLFDTTQMTYSTPYVAFIGQPQFVYPVAIAYLDNDTASV